MQTKTPTRQAPPKSQTPTDGYQTTPEYNTAQLKAFLKMIEAGDHPDPLQVMAALSAVSWMMSPNVDSATLSAQKKICTSQKKCRHCY